VRLAAERFVIRPGGIVGWMYRVLAVVLIGCGRIGFDVGGPAGDGSTASIIGRLPCDTAVTIDTGNDLPQDGLSFVSEPAALWLLVSEHVACDVHPIERYAVEVAPTAIALRDTGAIAQTTHAHTVTVNPASGGYVMAYVELYDGSTHTAKLGPGIVATGTHSFPLSGGAPPLARAGGGGLALIGLQSGVLVVVGIDDEGVATGTTTTLAPPGEGPDQPTMIATSSGLAAVWTSTMTGRCRIDLLRADLSIAAGPVDMAVGQCTSPQIAWVESARRIVVVTQDASVGGVYAAVWDDSLSPVVALNRVSPRAMSPQIIADTNKTWVAWADSATLAFGHARLDLDGTVTTAPPVGQIDTAVPHYHVLQVVDGYPIAMWLDVAQNRSLTAMRFCSTN